MEKKKIDVGFRVGELTVVERTEERRQGYVVWRCRCDCGRDILLDTRALQRGAVRNCGCKGPAKTGQTDLTGRRFGHLICVEPTDLRGPSGGVIWRCRCDCGNECMAVSTQLTGGYKKSCGCMNQERIKEYIGHRFGELTVIGYAGKRNGQHYWRCRCSCGQETVVGQTDLQSGHTQSCGCLQRKVYRENLKLVDGTSVTMIENRMKTPIKSNTSGYSGVYYNRRKGMWAAQITFKNKTYYLGCYPSLEDAVHARKRGEEMYDKFLEWYYLEYHQKMRKTNVK